LGFVLCLVGVGAARIGELLRFIGLGLGRVVLLAGGFELLLGVVDSFRILTFLGLLQLGLGGRHCLGRIGGRVLGRLDHALGSLRGLVRLLERLVRGGNFLLRLLEVRL